MAQLFHIDNETPDLGDWDGSYIEEPATIVQAEAAKLPGSGGTLGLRISGSNSRLAYVYKTISELAAGETRYLGGFIKPPVVAGQGTHIAPIQLSGSAQIAYLDLREDGKLYSSWWSDAGMGYSSPVGTYLSPGNWHYIVLAVKRASSNVAGDGGVKFYVDGNLVHASAEAYDNYDRCAGAGQCAYGLAMTADFDLPVDFDEMYASDNVYPDPEAGQDPAYTFIMPVQLQKSKTGLASKLRAKVYDTANTLVKTIAGTFTERGTGTGVYSWLCEEMPMGLRGFVDFYSTDDPTDVFCGCGINPEELEYVDKRVSAAGASAAEIDAVLSHAHGEGSWEGATAAPTVEEIDAQLTESHGEGGWEGAADWTADERAQIRDALGVEGEAAGAAGGQLQAIKARTDLIGSAEVDFAGSVNVDGTLDLVAGDDYLEANGKELTWRVDEWAGPNLAGATAVLAFVRMADWQGGTIEAELSATATAEMQDGTAVFTGELTAAQTGQLETSPPEQHYNYVYQLRVTTAAGHRLTIAGNGVHVEPGA